MNKQNITSADILAQELAEKIKLLADYQVAYLSMQDEYQTVLKLLNDNSELKELVLEEATKNEVILNGLSSGDESAKI